MASSYVTYTGDGAQTLFSVPFPFIDRSHVFVDAGGQLAPFTWLSNSSIALVTAPASGVAIKVFRSTPKDLPLVTFFNDQTLDVSHFNLAIRQALYVAQELEDNTGSVINQYIISHVSGDWFYDLTVSIPYTPLTGETVLIHPVVRQLTIPANFAGSSARADKPATDRTQVFTIYRGATAIGTITFSPGSAPGVFGGAGNIVVNPGDMLKVALTSQNDSTFRDIGITFQMTGHA
ncbi:phage tail fiber domain-containing protein [Roseixanthobacter pseudopolyaromaticivorans]|uniref:phage tail fiber domain-containing protein n=1 Tax=Xanthobacteraceae TaxID=335928 RepID=UPI003729EA23